MMFSNRARSYRKIKLGGNFVAREITPPTHEHSFLLWCMHMQISSTTCIREGGFCFIAELILAFTDRYKYSFVVGTMCFSFHFICACYSRINNVFYSNLQWFLHVLYFKQIRKNYSVKFVSNGNDSAVSWVSVV